MRAAVRDPDRRATLIAGALGLLSLGALQAMYGPAFPGLIERFGIGPAAAGTTVMLHFAGSCVSTAVTALLLTRFGYRGVLIGSGCVMAAGAAVVAFAPSWTWVLVGAALGGIGFGISNVSFNLLTARVFAPNAAPVLNLLSAVFGVGAVLGPLAVGAAGTALRLPFLAVAVTGGLAVAFTMRVPEPARAGGHGGDRVPWFAAAGFVLLYVFYVAAESGIATWETVHLEPTLGPRVAAYMTSVYWGAVTLGRLLAIPIAVRVEPRTLVLASSAAGLLALTGAHVPSIAPFAYAAAGLVFAPIFPTTLAWIARVFPRRSESVVPVAFALANLGPVAATGLIGAWVAAAGSSVVPTALALVAAVLLALVSALWWGTRP